MATKTATKPTREAKAAEPLSELQLFLKSLPESIAAMRTRTASQAVELSDEKWEELKAAVEKNLKHLQGRPLREAVLIVRRFVSCNAAQLRGLPRRIHVWKRPLATDEE